MNSLNTTIYSLDSVWLSEPPSPLRSFFITYYLTVCMCSIILYSTVKTFLNLFLEKKNEFMFEGMFENVKLAQFSISYCQTLQNQTHFWCTFNAILFSQGSNQAYFTINTFSLGAIFSNFFTLAGALGKEYIVLSKKYTHKKYSSHTHILPNSKFY